VQEAGKVRRSSLMTPYADERPRSPFADGGTIRVNDPAAELSRLKRESQMTKTVAGFTGAVELECGCGFGYTCDAHRKSSREDEVFEGFGENDFEGFGGLDDGNAEVYNMQEV
jgi:hypothetical protein